LRVSAPRHAGPLPARRFATEPRARRAPNGADPSSKRCTPNGKWPKVPTCVQSIERGSPANRRLRPLADTLRGGLGWPTLTATIGEGPLRALRSPEGDSPRALVVGSDALFRLGLAQLLREWDVDVLAHVESPGSAVELATALEPDVVVIELRRARSGPLGIARLCGLDPAPAVIALSAAPHHAEAVEMLQTGAAAYLAKDADAAKLAGAIRAVRAGEVLVPWYVADTVLAPLREARAPAGGDELAGEPLSEREVGVLHLLAQGMANDEIARELVVTTATVKSHVTRIVAKLGARNRTHAAVLAVHRRYV
jgi:DNA-binding NarL/FixJ family response regulator